jgi:LacI family transcriptional regulator
MTKHRVTIHDLAHELNTTASTVSRALQDHPRISQSMKAAVWDLAKKLNYQPNSIASSLRKGKGNTIGVIIPRIDRYFFPQ